MEIKERQIKKLHKGLGSCPEAQEAIKCAFPECFKEEWKDITREIDWRIDDKEHWGTGGFLRGYYKGDHLMTASKQRFEVSPLSKHYGSPNFKVETSSDKHTVWAKE